MQQPLPDTFIPGDVVENKLAPGKYMTVDKILRTTGGPRIQVIWFDSSGCGPFEAIVEPGRLRRVTRPAPKVSTPPAPPQRRASDDTQPISTFDAPVFEAPSPHHHDHTQHVHHHHDHSTYSAPDSAPSSPDPAPDYSSPDSGGGYDGGGGDFGGGGSSSEW